METLFQQFILSKAHKKDASFYSIGMVIVSLSTLITIHILSTSSNLFFTLILIFYWGVFGTLFLVAAPCFVVYLVIISKIKKNLNLSFNLTKRKPIPLFECIPLTWYFSTFLLNIFITHLVAVKLII